MATTALQTSYDTFLTETLDNVVKQVADNVTTRIPLLYWMYSNGRVRKTSGGAQIRLPIIKELNNTAQSYNDDDTLGVGKQDPVEAAFYNWKQHAVSVYVTGREMILNSGPEGIIDLVATLTEQAETSLIEVLDDDLHSANTESDNGLTGLQNLVSTSVSTGTTGNIARTNAYWRNIADTVSTNWSTDGIPSMLRLWRQVARGGEHPDIIEFTGSMFENYERGLSATISYNLPLGSVGTPMANKTLGDIGIQNLMFKGAPIIYGDSVPANTGYFLNTKYLWWQIQRDRDFVNTPFIRPSNKDVLVAQILLMSNVVSNRLAAQGVLTGSGDTYS